jgi:hypothetical protein
MQSSYYLRCGRKEDMCAEIRMRSRRGRRLSNFSIGLAASIAATVMLVVAPTAEAAICNYSYYSNYQYGHLDWGDEHLLELTTITDSYWSGDWEYSARRYDSSLSLTYNHYVFQPGTWSYVTSAVYRRTSMTPTSGYGLYSWYEEQYRTC